MRECRYIFNMGELKRKDNTLIFISDGKKTHIPIENIRELYLMNEVSINSKLLGILNKAGIIVHFYGYYGNHLGEYYPSEKYRSGNLLVKQVELFKEHREYVAKKFVEGIANNLYYLVYHYYRHGVKEVKEFLDFIREGYKSLLEKAERIEQILFVEGKIWGMFYSTFKYILPEDFVMNKRVKRPPDNPINSLISFGNSLLYSKVVGQLYRTHLNQEISYLHAPSDSRFSLSLDVAEVFKPDVVFKTIFELVNKKKLKVDKHFEKEYNYCLLNESGRKVFIKAFEERLSMKIDHSKLNRKVTYSSLFKLEGYKLIKMMVEGKVYEPFDSKEKR